MNENMDNNNNKLSNEKLFNIEYNYPKVDDINLQSKLYKKKEFYNYRIKHKPELNNYNDLKQYRNNKCRGVFELSEHQNLLGNFINPNTPYNGVLIFHGLGTGKTCAAISIAEKFKEQVAKYNKKIFIIVPGPNIRENWKNELIKCTGNTYLSSISSNYTNTINKQKSEIEAFQKILEYYKIMSYKSFYRKVLGEKIKDETFNDDNKKKLKYRKSDEGEFIRNESVDKIDNLSNSLLIIDEAHNITGNNYTDAIRKIIENSQNLKIVLMTATPMKNSADDIIDLINLLKPKNEQISKGKIFNSKSTHQLDFNENGEVKLRDYVKGCVSYLKGGDPYIFATKNEQGIISDNLKFTKIVPCYMLEFQNNIYNEVIKNFDDSLEKASGDISNFVFPLLNISENDEIIKINSKVSKNNNDENNEIYGGKMENNNNLKNSNSNSLIVGTHSKSGLLNVISMLLYNKKLFNNELNKFLELKEYDPNLIYLLKDNKTIMGNFMNIEHLKIFSTKFYKAMKNINNLVYGKKGAKPVFIYSNLVVLGINLFKTIMIQNGYLEFNENSQKTNSEIKDNTKCYFCGLTYKEHLLNKELIIKSPNHPDIKVIKHNFSPACFVTITGLSENEVNDELLPNEVRNIINNVFNNFDNYEGKYIKFILGSRVISEGYNLKNIGEVHILDVYFNFARVEQIAGRAIRRCSHFDTMSEQNPYPIVNVYKYCIVLENGISTEELLYQKAEKKHILVKRVERILQEEAIDCPLNIVENVDLKNIKENENCQEIKVGEEYDTQIIDKTKKICPSNCAYMKCQYKCSDPKLDELYIKENNSYKDLKFNEIDTSTFNNELIIHEINYCKKSIKNMYLFKYIYTLNEIVEYVEKIYENKQDLYDIYYIYKALDELIPITENEFNNFNDIIVDKYNRMGYLIYVNGFYIYQTFGENKNIPMYYRENNIKNNVDNVNLYEYMKFNNQLIKYSDIEKINIKNEYDFNSIINYYSKRKENEIVGIIDKEPNKKKNKKYNDLSDIFKIREKFINTGNKKRETGLQTYNGSVCFNSYKYEYLIKIMKKLEIPFNKNKKYKRTEICDKVKNKLLELEKYDNNNITYIIIPSNHLIYPFPYNIKDRCDFIANKITSEFTNGNISIDYDKKKKEYTIIVKNNDKINKNENFMKELKFEKIGVNWKLIIN
jgi:hypothetical protein